MIKKYFFLVLSMIFSFNNHAQNTEFINRRPAVAGRFYEAQAEALKKDIQAHFASAETVTNKEIKALIVPHAGYVFSGNTAAAAFKQLSPTKQYDNIFILTSSHSVSFDGASIYYIGHYNMPMGTVKVNTKLAAELVNTHTCFTYRHDAHSREHSLEVQLPFLQYIFGDDFQIIPIVIGTSSIETIETIAKALMPYFLENNLFVISTDLSHYPSYEEAVKIDNVTLNAILSNNTTQLINTLAANEQKNIKGLSTSLCGWSAVLSLLKMTERFEDIHPILIDYKNSGDSPYGEKDKVVGYGSVIFPVSEKMKNQVPVKNTGIFSLNDSEKNELLELSRKTLEEYIIHKKIPDLKASDFSKSLSEAYGVFVSLYTDKKLRGCIGRFFTNDPLYATIQQMTIASATQDTRFRPVTIAELVHIDIEISVLSPMKLITDVSEIELGTHGIYIKKGHKAGTFLPQVAIDTGWSLEEFLGHCARDKAGLSWDGWKDAEVYIYTALVFGEK